MDTSDFCGCHLSLSCVFFWCFLLLCFLFVFVLFVCFVYLFLFYFLKLLLTAAVGIICITYSCHCIFQVSLGCFALASVGDAAYCSLGTGCVNEPGHGS